MRKRKGLLGSAGTEGYACPVMRTAIAVAIAFVLFAAYASVLAAGQATVAFSPAAANATVGSSVAIDVTIANIDPSPGLANYDLTLHFDPAVVRLDSFVDSGFIRSGENVVVCATGKIDNGGGSVEAQCQALPLSGAPGVSTTGAVVLIHGSFTALAVGASPLTLAGTLAGPSGAAIPATFSSGSIHVNVAAASTPTTMATTAATASASATSNPAPTATATTIPASPGAATGTATSEGVTLPDTGDGGRSPSGNLAEIPILLGGIAALVISIGLSLRQPWRRHTRT